MMAIFDYFNGFNASYSQTAKQKYFYFILHLYFHVNRGRKIIITFSSIVMYFLKHSYRT